MTRTKWVVLSAILLILLILLIVQSPIPEASKILGNPIGFLWPGKDYVVLDEDGCWAIDPVFDLHPYATIWSPQGFFLCATGSPNDGTASTDLYKISTNAVNKLRLPVNERVFEMSISNDGRYVVFENSTSISHLIDLASKEVQYKYFDPGLGNVRFASWSFDDQYIATTDNSGSYHVHDVRTGKLLYRSIDSGGVCFMEDSHDLIVFQFFPERCVQVMSMAGEVKQTLSWDGLPPESVRGVLRVENGFLVLFVRKKGGLSPWFYDPEMQEGRPLQGIRCHDLTAIIQVSGWETLKKSEGRKMGWWESRSW
jgi:WD40 repeat protein